MAWEFLDNQTLQYNNTFQIRLLKGSWHSPLDITPIVLDDMLPVEAARLLRQGMDFAIKMKHTNKRRSQFGMTNAKPDTKKIAQALDRATELLPSSHPVRESADKPSTKSGPKIISKQSLKSKIVTSLKRRSFLPQIGTGKNQRPILSLRPA